MATAYKLESNEVDPLDVSRAELYTEHKWQEPFRRLRAEAPVYWCANSEFGPYWSVSSYKAIQHVEALPDIYSSSWEHGGITIADRDQFEDPKIEMPMFIAMDRPKHTEQRRVVSPAFTPSEMVRMSDEIRQRTAETLDALPWGQPFDWVDRVSIELTTGMLAVLFDFPWADRRKLTEWSDWAGDIEIVKDPAKRDQRLEKLFEMGGYFKKLWDERVDKAPTPDLISMMIHSEAMKDMSMGEFMGNLVLLIVGGNDTTRNTMSGLAYSLNKFPDQRAMLEADPSLIPNAVSEIIRWQTPLAHMRRTALSDTELEGHKIKAGQKIIMWYISANRDESIFPDADKLDIKRDNARRHLSFGYGIHRCVGARLAELQITILLEEMGKRRMRVNVLEEPVRVAQSFVNGYRKMMVQLEKY
ncbi:MAG: cytochrome P450 [Sphingomonadales bacterium]|jgi:cytochrome P450|nr:cytochrome P450 [Sphingomonadales bacterium]MBK6493353.1 cytochrome P450 [Sphingomonadales bacterium]MBK6719774.1 cytochrome P450 [Sphingomonadales bacterium]MBK8271791.1 cytochrome P450 [Sphingomonadales bacterium]MBK8861320.1 cytochrome P450 [Sphingomonadales bacterium]